MSAQSDLDSAVAMILDAAKIQKKFTQGGPTEMVDPGGGIEPYKTLAGFAERMAEVPPISVPSLPTTGTPVLVWNPTTQVYESRELTLNDIAAAFDASVATTAAAMVEIGQTISNPQFTATYNRTPTSASLGDSDGNPVQDVLGAPNPITRPYSYSKNNNGQTVTWTLTAGQGAGSDSASIGTTWASRIYFGSIASGATIDEALVEALTSNVLRTSRAGTYAINIAGTDRPAIWIPDVLGTNPSFVIGGFTYVFEATPLTITNAAGLSVPGRLWKPSSGLFANLNLVVS